MSDYTDGFTAGHAACGELTAEQAHELLSRHGGVWMAGFNDGWYWRGQELLHRYGADLLATGVVAK